MQINKCNSENLASAFGISTMVVGGLLLIGGCIYGVTNLHDLALPLKSVYVMITGVGIILAAMVAWPIVNCHIAHTKNHEKKVESVFNNTHIRNADL